jgi:hypothetical protein
MAGLLGTFANDMIQFLLIGMSLTTLSNFVNCRTAEFIMKR